MDERALDEAVTGCAAAHQRVLAHLDSLLDTGVLDDARIGSPSLLPGWTVGHVLTHIARNADSVTGMFEAAERGEVGVQYPGGVEQRAADIESGAGRPAAEQVADVRRSIWRLEGAWGGASAAAWTGQGRIVSGDLVPIVEWPERRWREVEIHHADLGLPGFTFDDWSSAFVRRELNRQAMVFTSRAPMGMTQLPPEALALTPNRRLAWLTGRLTVAGLPDPGPWR